MSAPTDDAPSPASRSSSDPAASMSLLRDLVRDSGESEYAAAAARERGAGARRTPARLVLLVLALVGVAFLITAALGRTLDSAPAAAAERDALRARIAAATADVAARSDQVTGLRADLAGAEDRALATTAEGRALTERIDALRAATGFTVVTGPGVLATLDDAPPDDDDGLADPNAQDPGRVLDRDIQVVVNGLWQAGAEAVAINDQRLTGASAIRAAGEAILVDFTPLRPPYRITAIGDPAALLTALQTGPAGVELAALRRDYGIRSAVQDGGVLVLPASKATP